MNGWLNKNTNGVCPCDHHEGDEWERVVVIPLSQWRRLVELSRRFTPTCKCEGDCEACREDAEIEAIIASVEVSHE